jgi:hypothetical protein
MLRHVAVAGDAATGAGTDPTAGVGWVESCQSKE